MVEIKTAYNNVRDILKKANGEYEFEAMQLVTGICGISKTDLLIGAGSIEQELANELLEKARIRAKGYPLQYILGEWEFYGRKYILNENVLIPRQDTETLCEAALDFAKNCPNSEAIDLCSGSGCVAITLAADKNIKRVYAVEKMPAAFEVLKQNIEYNSAEVLAISDDVLTPQESLPQVMLITANPPYLTIEDMQALQTEVSFEPETALYGGEDGLLFYREITQNYKDNLKSGGRIFYEIGKGQEEAVQEILLQNGFCDICTLPDICGIIRVISGKKQ